MMSLLSRLRENRAERKIRETETETQSGSADMSRLAIVVATDGNGRGLSELLDSLRQLDQAPWRVIICDTKPDTGTRRIVQTFAEAVQTQWAESAARTDDKGGNRVVNYIPVVGPNSDPQRAGAYNRGVRRAYALGAQWFWLLDSTVAVLPDALATYEPWMASHDVIQSGVYDYYGEDGFTGVHLDSLTGYVSRLAPVNSRAGYRVTNAVEFQDALISRRILEQVGPPDPRIVTGFDGVVWGYLASQVTNPIFVPGFVCRSTKENLGFDLPDGGTVVTRGPWERYYLMRGRGFIARALMMHGDFHPTLFACGTIRFTGEEVGRLILTDHTRIIPGLLEIGKGCIAARRVMYDTTWTPMRGR